MKSKQKRAWMTPSEVSLFCQQVELLLQSGIPLYEGMRSLADNYQSTPYREALTELAQKVDETEMDDRIGHLVSLIEPTLVTVLSLIIGAILLAVMLPLASILTTIA